MSKTPKTPGQMVEYIAQVKRNQEAEWKRLAEADQQLQALTLWTIPDLVEALTNGRVHIAPGHDPALTAPTSAQEALDLAWDLAHPVKEGQVIPKGAKWMKKVAGNVREYTMSRDYTVTANDTYILRTLDPLPEPAPAWLGAPAVTADCTCNPGGQTVYVSHGGIGWTCSSCDTPYAPEDLENVTPLYPKEDTPHDAPRYRTFSFRDDKPWGTSLGGDPA